MAGMGGTDTICIESDDEAEAAPPPATTAQPLDGFFCHLLAPGSGSGASPGAQVKKQSLGPVSVSLRQHGEGGDGSVLEFIRAPDARNPRAGRPDASARIHIGNISHINVDTRGHTMINLRFQQAVYAGELGAVGDDGTGVVQELGLIPRAGNDVRRVEATLRWWLPHVAVQGAVGARLNSENAAALRLEGIELTVRDIKLLENEKCLNDSVLDFFLRLVVEVVSPPRIRGDLHVTSTFFYNKLTSGNVANGEEGWHNVRRWTRSLSGGLLAQRFVVVPINEQNVHWWLAVVCYPRRALEPEQDDDPLATLGEKPRIVQLDSAQEPVGKDRAMAFLKGYIWREWCERHRQATLPEGKEEMAKMMNSVPADVPKQDNSYDCGIFVIEYLLHLLTSRSALMALGLSRHNHWFAQDRVTHRRKQLRWIACKLRAEAVRRSEYDVACLLQDDELRGQVNNAFMDRPKPAKRTSDVATGAPHPKRRL